MARPPVRHLRWWMIGMICLVTVINYIDRQTLSVLAPTIMDEFKMSNVEYSRVVTTFLAAYTISQALSGRIIDRIGVRRGFMLFVGIWTIASMLHSTARSAVQLAAFRFLLGLGEAGNWPGAAKAVSEWFPMKERALGMAIFNSGAVIGAVIAPPLIAWVALSFGWRYAFFIGASLSVVLMALWYRFYQSPAQHARLSDDERAYILSDQPVATGVPPRPWRELFGYRQTWAVLTARFFTDPIWWFLIAWLPTYLKNARGFSLSLIGLLAWIPFLLADMGSLTGGFVSGRLIRQGWSVDRARKTVLLGTIALIPTGVLLLMNTTSDAAALVAIGAIAFGFQGWIVNIQTLPSDCFPRQDVGGVAGLGGAAAGLASMGFTLLVGWVVDHYSYQPVFLMVAAMALIGVSGWWLIMRRIEPVDRVARA
jgi:ACS family hexuronate transporter-like MFS transporter